MSTLFRPFDDEAAVRKYRKNLPHWAQEGATYFVTFRTADSVPQSKLLALVREKEQWLQQHPKPWSHTERSQHRRLSETRIEEWLDEGHGACLLRSPVIGSIVASALSHFDASRYALDEFVVMPNHVHVLVQPWNKHSLAKILHSWKSYTALLINERAGRKGSFWLDESFDHIVRSVDHLERFRAYIRDNPNRARLRPKEFILGKGSGLHVEE